MSPARPSVASAAPPASREPDADGCAASVPDAWFSPERIVDADDSAPCVDSVAPCACCIESAALLAEAVAASDAPAAATVWALVDSACGSPVELGIPSFALDVRRTLLVPWSVSATTGALVVVRPVPDRAELDFQLEPP